MDETLYTHDLLGEAFALDYAQEADRWIELLLESLREKMPDATGNSNTAVQASSDFPYPHREIALTGANGIPIDTPTLKMVPVHVGQNTDATGLYLFLAAKRPITETDIATWGECISSAKDRLSEPHPEFEWAAAIGQTSNMTSPRHALKMRSVVGGLTVRPGGSQHMAAERGMTPTFNGTSFRVTWPIIVESKSRGYNWFVASREAGKSIHKLAALLSLAWGSTWELVHAAQQTAPGALKVPKSTGFPHMPPRGIPMPRTVKVLPKWIGKAFVVIDSNLILANALNAYYQGLLMEQEHPSFALVAFVVAIEAVGKNSLGNKCPCCGKEYGAKQKFKAGLGTVISDQAEVARLADAYAERSDTVHEGVLHGNETLLGALPAPSIFNPDSADFFAFTDLLKIKQAARKALIKAIKRL